MKQTGLKITGFSVSIISIIFLAYMILSGVIGQAIYSTTKVHGDNWIWLFLIIPLIFIITGFYYIWLAYNKGEANKPISASAILQFIAVIGAIIAIIPDRICILNHGEFCGFALLLAGIPITILGVISIILIIVGILIKPVH